MRNVSKIITLTFLALASIAVYGQRTITLDECQQQARENYPAIKQKKLVQSAREYNVANARSGYLPQVAIYGQATYQSDVTTVPIDVPGFSIEPLSKDQYKLYGEVTQTIYDGGAISRTAAIRESGAQVEDQQIEVELYKIRERINQLYFGALLIDEQLEQVDLVRKDIETSLKQLDAAYRNGIALKSNIDILKAERLKTDQREIELKASRQAYIQMLSLFLNEELAENTKLEKPLALTLDLDESITRPELTLFNYQSQLYQSQYQLTNSRLTPKVGLFLQAGFGNPALNMLKNEFDGYYIGGVRLSWNLSGFYNSSRDKQLLDVNLQSVNTQRELFLFNTNLMLRQQGSEAAKLEKLIAVDDELIGIREEVKKVSQVQLDNGVISASDFILQVNAEDQARQAKILHEIQLLMTQYNYQNTIGTN